MSKGRDKTTKIEHKVKKWRFRPILEVFYIYFSSFYQNNEIYIPIIASNGQIYDTLNNTLDTILFKNI